MKSKKYHSKCNYVHLVRNTLFLGLFLLYVFFGLTRVSAQSSPEFIQGKDTLTVYSDVPLLTASPKFRIKVRSAATDNQWKDCYAYYTYNVHDFVSDPNIAGTNSSNPSSRQNYQSFTRNWSHTYGNIEMSRNQAVEVEISKIDGANVVAIVSATVHPKEKATPTKIKDGKVYFTLYNPAQIVIDIDGQMDNFNKGLDDTTSDLSYVAHTISLFANPVLKKPSLTNSRVLKIYPGTRPTYDYTQYDTICFQPGIHSGYKDFKVYPTKTYYIPGDAIVYGTFNNEGQTAVAQDIKIYGYGTICGTGIMNPYYVSTTENDNLYKSVAINNCMNVEVQGLCFTDPAYHTVNIDAWGGRTDKTKQETFARWVKVISWRGNGDGIGSAHQVEDCFLRTADDASYVKGNRKRCTIWKDFNAAAFHFSGIPDPASFFPIVIEDCDIIYNRSTSTNPLAGVFVQRAAGLPAVQRTVDVTVKNIRITDPKPNTPVFNLFSKDSTRISRNPDTYSFEYGSSYSGIKFQNITIISPPPNGVKQKLKGHGDTDTSGANAFGPAPWYGGIYFDNVAIDGRKLNINDFTINRFVKDIFFDSPVIIDTPGTSSWVAPEGITSVSVECWGGGGGGGGATASNYAGGGAGGSYVISANVAVVPLTSYTVTVGAGGVLSNTGGANGNAGGTTSFGSTIPVIANGGTAGSGVTTSGQLGSGGVNLAGGSGGTVTLGANGSNAVASISGGGGKGGGLSGGAGGSSKTSLGAGNSGSSPGGGGSGAYGALSGSRQGGAGGSGFVRISYTVAVSNAPVIGTATASGVSGQALLSFTAPSFNGNSTITTYTATSSPGGITGTLSQAGSGTITVNGLTNGTAYTFIVKATNFAGQSAASGTSNSVTPMNQPTIVSKGNGGGSWTSTATWVGGIVPAETDYVSILGSDVITVNGIGICKNLIIASAASLNVNSGSLTVNNTIINNGTIRVENNANFIQTAISNTNIGTGTATVKRNSNPLKRLDYTLWSSPVLGTKTLEEFSPLTTQFPNRFYEYFEPIDQYRLVPVYGAFDVAKGYLIRMPNTDPTIGYDAGSSTLNYSGVFTGVLNNGNIAVTLTKDLNGYTAVGNPYPSVIDADAFISANTTNIETTLYFWRKTNSASGSAYATYTAGGGTTVTATSETPNGKIQVGQGFFVKAKSVGTIANFFTNAMRDLTPTSTQFFKTKQVVDKDRVWLNLTNTTGIFSQALIAYITYASQGIDIYDGQYINDSPIALTSSINGVEYTIQGRPAFDITDVVALNFKTDVAGDYTIAIDHTDGVFAAGQGVYLLDNKTGIETDLKSGAYNFSAVAGVDNSRFTLKYQKTLKVDAPDFNDNSVQVYQKNGILYVISESNVIKKIEVFDIQGRVIAQQKNVKANTATINNLIATHQVLIVKITGEDNKIVTKKIVN